MQRSRKTNSRAGIPLGRSPDVSTVLSPFLQERAARAQHGKPKEKSAMDPILVVRLNVLESLGPRWTGFSVRLSHRTVFNRLSGMFLWNALMPLALLMAGLWLTTRSCSHLVY